MQLDSVEFAHVTNIWNHINAKVGRYVGHVHLSPSNSKGVGWDWYEWDQVKQLKDQLFLPMQHFIATYTPE